MQLARSLTANRRAEQNQVHQLASSALPILPERITVEGEEVNMCAISFFCCAWASLSLAQHCNDEAPRLRCFLSSKFSWQCLGASRSYRSVDPPRDAIFRDAELRPLGHLHRRRRGIFIAQNSAGSPCRWSACRSSVSSFRQWK